MKTNKFICLITLLLILNINVYAAGSWEGGSTFIDHYPIPHNYDYIFTHTIFNPETGELIQGAGYPRFPIPFPGNPDEGNISGHGKLLHDYMTKKCGCAPNIDEYVDEMKKWRGGGVIFNDDGTIVATHNSQFLNDGMMDPDDANAHGQSLADNLDEEVKKPKYVGGSKNFDPSDGPGYKPRRGPGGRVGGPLALLFFCLDWRNDGITTACVNGAGGMMCPIGPMRPSREGSTCFCLDRYSHGSSEPEAPYYPPPPFTGFPPQISPGEEGLNELFSPIITIPIPDSPVQSRW